MHRRYWHIGWLFLAIASLTHCTAYDPSLLDPGVVGPLTTLDAGYAEQIDAAQPNTDPPFPASPDDVPPLPSLPPETRCGDGVISGVEKCDTAIPEDTPGACPRQCPALTPCATRVLNGTACQAECVLVQASCADGDECCPSYCTPANDDDCSSACGDGRIDSELGETCEPGMKECEASDADCADDDPCTQDRLIGGPMNCNSSCSHLPISERVAGDMCCPMGANAVLDSDCPARCGNGILEPGEECEGGEGCGGDCKRTTPAEEASCLESFAATECQKCLCMHCTSTYLACRSGADATQNMLCSDVMACTERSRCVDDACYCGQQPFCAVPFGPCRGEIERAAGTTDGIAIGMRRRDLMNPLGRAQAADDCKLDACADICGSGAGGSKKD